VKFISSTLLLLAVATAPSCKPADLGKSADENTKIYERAFDGKNNLLVFQSDALEGGPIQGLIKVDDPTLKSGSPEMLQRALISCGETRVLIDLSWTHHEYVSVPLKANNPFREMTDLQLVDCVRHNTSFGFFAGVGRGPDANSAPFESLHAKKN
jgi:hypothetical protein